MSITPELEVEYFCDYAECIIKQMCGMTSWETAVQNAEFQVNRKYVQYKGKMQHVDLYKNLIVDMVPMWKLIHPQLMWDVLSDPIRDIDGKKRSVKYRLHDGVVFELQLSYERLPIDKEMRYILSQFGFGMNMVTFNDEYVSDILKDEKPERVMPGTVRELINMMISYANTHNSYIYIDCDNNPNNPNVTMIGYRHTFGGAIILHIDERVYDVVAMA